MGWISVKDRLPDRDDYVLACFDDGFIATIGYADDWELWDGLCGEPTHWMPLPDPPEMEDES